MNLLSISPDQYGESLSFGDALSFGSQMLILGMVTVFAVLILLWGCLTIFKLVFHGAEKKPKKEKPVVAIEPTPVVQYTQDTEIVAVIAAAIAMAESESNGMKFRVVSFRRK